MMARGTIIGLLLAMWAWGAPVRAQMIDPLPTPATNLAILDHETGLLLHCKNCDTPMPPASMSKLMTMLLVAEKLRDGSLKPDTMMPVSERAWRHGAQSDGSHMFLPLGSQVSVQDLIRGVVIVSANDACIVLAEGISGSEEAFVDLMNRRAQALGLKTARFRNSTGLPDPDHVISALDLARLAAHIIREFPDLYRLYSEPALSFNGKKQENRNPLLGRFEGADGVKTGHTAASGYGLIGSAVLNGQRRIIVFNGLPTMAARASEAQRLMRAAFFDFEARRLFEKGAAVGAANVFLGGRKDVGLVTALPIYIAAHRSVAAGMKASIVYDGPIPAPVKAGEEVARLVIEAPGAQPVSYPLLAARGVGKANWFALAGAGIARTLGAGP